MKTIGLIGGMSEGSTVPYYRLVNEFAKERLGGLHSAKITLHSVDFHDVHPLQQAGDRHAAGRLLGAAVQSPLLHIADPTAQVALTAADGV